MIRKVAIIILCVASCTTLIACAFNPWLRPYGSCLLGANPPQLVAVSIQNRNVALSCGLRAYTTDAQVPEGVHRYWHGFGYSYWPHVMRDEEDKPVCLERLHEIEFPLWALFAALSAYPCVALVRSRLSAWRFRLSASLDSRRARKEAQCVQCGYNLTGNTSGVCPECGEPTIRQEAKAELSRIVAEYRERSYAEWVARIDDKPIVLETTTDTDRWYEVEIEAFWDGGRGGDVRVVFSIDDGGWRAFLPLTETVIVAREGAPAGE